MPQQLLSGENRAEGRGGLRTRSFGQDYPLTIVDRFGVWLSARQIRRCVGSLRQKAIGDFGCGYSAAYVRTVLAELDRAVLIDSTIANDLKKNPKVTAIEGI